VSLVLLGILLSAGAFALWLAGNLVKARAAERRAILEKGVEVQAEVVRSSRGRIDYRFDVTGWPRPVTGRGRLRKNAAPAVGQRIAVRYLPGHPHISAIVQPHR
jgi:hypothetical protein